MKCFIVLIALVGLLATAAAFTEKELVQRSLCTYDYQCKDGCWCHRPSFSSPKLCFCPKPGTKEIHMVCRRREYL